MDISTQSTLFGVVRGGCEILHCSISADENKAAKVRKAAKDACQEAKCSSGHVKGWDVKYHDV